MTTQIIQKLPGKTQTILLAETKSERWLSWVRLACAGFLTALFVPIWVLGMSGRESVFLQASAIAALSGYSVFYLLYTRQRRRVAQQYLYLLTFFDIAVITVIIWSFLLPCPMSNELPSVIFSAYFIAIAFTAFHHRISLSVYSAILSIVGFTVISWVQLLYCREPLSLACYFTKAGLLAFAGALSAAVSRNNYQTVRKVLSTELRYDTLVERLPEVIFTLDRHGTVIWSNNACTSLLGLLPEKLVGMKINSFFSKPDALKLEQGGMKATVEIHDCKGERKFADLSIQRVVRGLPEEAFDGLMADVTDRELAIAQREEMVDRLFQYQKMESIGSLASGMAHDFNNILQTIIDLSSLIAKESGEPETKKRMELILETTADARFLISELMALGRKKLIDYHHISIGSFFTSLYQNFRNQLGPDCNLRLEIPEGPLKIQGDPDYLKRVFQNLFGNARDAMPRGGTITVSVSTIKAHGGAGMVVIRISDTGSGIAPELTEKIFDPFFTTKKPGKGTGLGLALVRRIVTLHYGRVSVEQTGPAGTTFRIELPLVSSDESEVDTKSIMMNRASATILMLEDDRKIRNIMKFFLTELGYSILEASTGEDAVKSLRNNVEKCHVLITDWKLVGEDPHQTIEKLRAIKNDLIVIVVSGYPPNAKSIERLKIYRWFTKPYDRNQLDIEIQRALRRLPSRAS